jgi:hypothetical protein
MKTAGLTLRCALLAMVVSLSMAAASSANIPWPKPTIVPLKESVRVSLVRQVRQRKIRSCSEADNRKHHANAIVDAGTVACEFPPKSTPNIGSAQGSSAAAIFSGEP